MLFFICFLIPLVGTSLGAAAVFFIRHRQSEGLTVAFNGLAAGVMVASAIFSLLLPALETAATPTLPILGLFFGFSFFFLVSCLAEKSEKDSSSLSAFAVTLHNLPEGMAVGIALAGVLAGVDGLTAGGVLALSLGIAIQNIPEGSIISLPAYARGKGRFPSFMSGVLSGTVEPIGAFLAFLLSEITASFLPFFLSFAASAMLSVATGELTASFRRKAGAYGRLCFALGFVFMTVLDVVFS